MRCAWKQAIRRYTRTFSERAPIFSTLECRLSRVTFGSRDVVASAARRLSSRHELLHLASHTSHVAHVFFV